VRIVTGVDGLVVDAVGSENLRRGGVLRETEHQGGGQDQDEACFFRVGFHDVFSLLTFRRRAGLRPVSVL
jgi:hypothetical protein